MRILARYLFGTILLGSGLVGCESHPTEQTQPVGSSPKKVSLLQIHSTQNLALERAPGTVRPRTDATLEAKLLGRVSKLFVSEGSLVKEGQALLLLDAPETQARLDQTRASARQAEQDKNRLSQLLASNAVSKQEYEAAETRSKVGAASVAEAEAMVSYTKILAPFDGVVTEKLINLGDLAVPGKALLKVERQNDYRFEADVSETAARNLVLKDNLEIRLSGFDRGIQGHISEISPTTDPNSRTLRIKIDLPQSAELRSGQFGYALIPTEAHASIRIPRSALIQRGEIEIVFVAQNNKAILRLVRSGKHERDSVEILSGIEEGDEIIIDSAAQLLDGDSIEARHAE